MLFLYLFFGVFITFGLFPADISPFYLLIITMLLFAQLFRQPVLLISRDSLWVVMIAIAIVVIDVLVMRNLDIAKMMASLMLIFAFMNLKLPKITYRFALIVALIWFGVSVLTFVAPKFFSILFFRLGTSAGRGAPGLGPEPGYWGLASSMMVLFFDRYKFSDKPSKSSAAIQLLFAGSVILTLSFLAYVYFLLVFWHIFGARKTGMILGFALLVVVFLLPSNFRVVELVESILRSGLFFVLSKDTSSAQRLNGFGLFPDLFAGVFPPFGSFLTQLSGMSFDYPVSFNPVAGFQLILRYGFVGLLMSVILLILYVKPFVGLGSKRSVTPIVFLVIIIIYVGPIGLPYFLMCINKLLNEEKT